MRWIERLKHLECEDESERQVVLKKTSSATEHYEPTAKVVLVEPDVGVWSATREVT